MDVTGIKERGASTGFLPITTMPKVLAERLPPELGNEFCV